jgi:hypothetical protein
MRFSISWLSKASGQIPEYFLLAALPASVNVHAIFHNCLVIYSFHELPLKARLVVDFMLSAPALPG